MLLRALLAAVLLACSAQVAAVNTQEAGQGLTEVRQAIAEAQADVQKKQAVRKKVQQTLNQTQGALSRAQKEWDSINRQHREAWRKLQKLQNELETMQAEIAAAKTQVARLLSAYYRNRRPHAVELFLKNAEASQKARFLEYSRYINQANEKVIADLGRQQSELKQREAAVARELGRLKTLKAQKQAALAKLGKDNAKAKRDSEQIDRQINAQSERIKRLKADENRLNQVIAGIARRQAAQRKQEAAARNQAAKARLEAEKKRAAQSAKTSDEAARRNTETGSGKPKTAGKTAPRSTLTDEDRALQAPYEESTAFSRLQGRLNKPSGGSISGRFGQSKDGGGTWRGLFFSTPPAAVRSVAAGTVVHAGIIGGYGSTVIIDHGGGYLSVYAGLSGVSAAVGSHVQAGGTIGSSGSMADEQGLYFELRYKGSPINPSSWLR